MAKAAASFISSVICLARPSKAPLNIIVVDVSFISLEKIAYKIAEFKPTHLICLIKPQFENAKINKNGIVKDKSQYKTVISNVAEEFLRYGLNLNGISVSPIKGGDGNIEYLALFKKINKEADLNGTGKYR